MVKRTLASPAAECTAERDAFVFTPPMLALSADSAPFPSSASSTPSADISEPLLAPTSPAACSANTRGVAARDGSIGGVHTTSTAASAAPSLPPAPSLVSTTMPAPAPSPCTRPSVPAARPPAAVASVSVAACVGDGGDDFTAADAAAERPAVAAAAPASPTTTTARGAV
jgi:hypothetical protein